MNLEITGAYRLLHPIAEYSKSHGIFNKVSHKTQLNKFKIVEIIHCLPSDHTGIKLR
jgi:hypothetical protein